jgi:hypothetical protein
VSLLKTGNSSDSIAPDLCHCCKSTKPGNVRQVTEPTKTRNSKLDDLVKIPVREVAALQFRPIKAVAADLSGLYRKEFVNVCVNRLAAWQPVQSFSQKASVQLA